MIENFPKWHAKMNLPESKTNIDELFNTLHQQVTELQRTASIAKQTQNLSPIEKAGQRIRAERKKQGLTLNELCDLSNIAYVTLVKIEKGTANIRLESLMSVASALGMKLWIG